MGEILRPGGPIVCVVGARPNYMKMAPLIRAFGAQPGLPGVVLVHTGQHYDIAMNERLFADLELPAPGPQSRSRVGHPRGADRRGDAPLRAGGRRPQAELRDRRRRRQLDARLQPGRGEEARAGRPRRSGPAQLRPRHARGDQSHPDRPDRRPPLHDRARGRRQSAARRHRAAIASLRRQRDDRFAAAASRGVPSRRRRRWRAPASMRHVPRGREGYGVVTLHRPSNVDSPDALRRGARGAARCRRARAAGLADASARSREHRALRLCVAARRCADRAAARRRATSRCWGCSPMRDWC